MQKQENHDGLDELASRFHEAIGFTYAIKFDDLGSYEDTEGHGYGGGKT